MIVLGKESAVAAQANEAVDTCKLTLNRNSSMVFNYISTVFGHLVPVHDIPPVGNILWSAVLVLKVVRMFPNIKTQDGKHDFIYSTLHEWIVLVGSANKLELVSSLVDTDPNPPRSKQGSRGCSCFKL